MGKRVKTRKSVNGKRRGVICAVIIALFLAGVWLIWGNSALMTSEITIRDTRIPSGFNGFCIAQVSDLHDAVFGEGNAALISLIKGAKPDIIAITGDLIDSNRTDIDAAIAFAQCAVEIAPVYYVTGNHEGALMEYWILREGLAQAGVHILSDDAETLDKDGDTVNIIGLDDPNFATREDVARGFDAMIRGKLDNLVRADEYNILLVHRPELIESYSAGGADLALCGHAHGGQIRLPFIGGIIAPGQGFFPEYDSGLYTVGNTSMVVSRGLGNSVIPLRVNNRPEVVIITLESGA